MDKHQDLIRVKIELREGLLIQDFLNFLKFSEVVPPAYCPKYLEMFLVKSLNVQRGNRATSPNKFVV